MPRTIIFSHLYHQQHPVYRAQDECASLTAFTTTPIKTPLVSFLAVSSAPRLSLSFSFSPLDLSHGAGAFDVWQNKRLSTGLVRSLPLPSKIDSCDPPLRVLSFVFFLRDNPSFLLHFSSESVYTYTNLLLTREERLRRTGGMPFPDRLVSACTTNEPSRTNYRKLVHFLSHSGYLSTSRWPSHSSSQLSFIHETRFLSTEFLSRSNTMLPSGCEIVFVWSFLWFNTSFRES